MKTDYTTLATFLRIAWECARVTVGATLVVGTLWLLFAVEPGRGYSWPY